MGSVAGSDGSHLLFHDNAQATMNANGVITVSFDHALLRLAQGSIPNPVPRPLDTGPGRQVAPYCQIR